MTSETEIAYLSVELKSKEHSMADVSFIVEDMETLVVASLWGAMIQPELDDETLRMARSVLRESAAKRKASVRFYPGFGFEAFLSIFPVLSEQSIEAGFDPYDPLDAGLQMGMNSWFRRAINSHDPELYQDFICRGEKARAPFAAHYRNRDCDWSSVRSNRSGLRPFDCR